jgi:hypothetical protein
MSGRRPASLLAALPVAAALLTPWLVPTTAHAGPVAAPPWTQSTGTVTAPHTGIDQPYSGAAVGDLLADGRTEVVAAFPDGSVRAYFADGSPVPGWPVWTGGLVDASPTLADLRGDGRLEVIVPSRSGWVFVYNGDGTPFGRNWPQHALFGKPWAATDFVPDFFASAAVGDLFGDGRREVVTTGWDHRVYAWTADGVMLPGFPVNLWDTAWDTPVLVDLEGRGQLDIVAGSDSNGGPTEPNPKGGVWWALRPDGSLIWKRIQDEVPWSSAAAATLAAGETSPTVVAGTGHYFTVTTGTPHGTYVDAYTASGGNRAGWPVGTPGPNFASPAIGDLLNRGDGSREVVQVNENAQIFAWNASGQALPGWPVTPTNGTQLGSPIIAPVGGTCGTGNGVWIPAWYHLLGYCANGTLGADIPLPGPAFGTPTVADLGNGHLSIVATFQADGSNTRWSVGAWPLSGATTLPAGAWPTFHGNMQRSGTLAPSATAITLGGMQATSAFPVAWTVDAGSVPATAARLWARDGSGPWLPASTTAAPAISTTFHGAPGHSYAFYVQALSRQAAAPPPGSVTQATTTAGGAPSLPFASMQAVDAYGGLDPVGSPPAPVTAQWPGWPIVRGVAVARGGLGGYVLDGFGGIHPFGGEPALDAGTYWPGWDIARGIVLRADGHSGYVLDGWGGIHAFGGAPAVTATGYWRGWDIARGIALAPDGQSGYVLDGFGGVHPFGSEPALDAGTYWPGWDIARGIALDASGHGGYVLDGWGGVHGFGDAPLLNAGTYWPGWDIARGIALIPGTVSQGYVLDGWGGVHAFGGAPALTADRYTPGWDIARGISIGGLALG